MPIPQPPSQRTLLLRGALVGVDLDNPFNTSFVPFQYNPLEVKRSLTPKTYQAAKGDIRFTGAPTESLSLKVQLQAVDALVKGTADSLYARLAAMELLIYPSSVQFVQYYDDVHSAKLWAAPPQSPRTLFIWGPGRILPVTLKKMDINETQFNPALGPILADVDLSMDVLPLEYSEGTDFGLLLANLVRMEVRKVTFQTQQAAEAISDIASLLL